MTTDTLRIYHNPRCSKSRATLELIEGLGHKVKIIDYLKTPPDVDELRGLCRRLGLAPRELLRTSEAAYRDAGLDEPSLTDEHILGAIAATPILMQRPIVVADERAALGRPPENVLAILT